MHGFNNHVANPRAVINGRVMVVAAGNDDFTTPAEKGHATEINVVNAEVMGFGWDKEHVVIFQAEIKEGEG